MYKEHEKSFEFAFISRCTLIASENQYLKNKIYNQESLMEKHGYGSKSLNLFLGDQKFANDRSGLGYEPKYHDLCAFANAKQPNMKMRPLHAKCLGRG